MPEPRPIPVAPSPAPPPAGTGPATPTVAERFDPLAGRRQSAAGWRLTASIAAAFTALVGLAMFVAHLQHKSSDPWKAPLLLSLKEQLRTQPKDDALKTRIRELDLRLRQRYFRLLTLKASGVYLLCGGAAVFLFAASQVRQLNRRPFLPQPKPDAAAQLVKAAQSSRFAVAACGVVAAAAFVLVALALGRSSPLPRNPTELEALFAEATGGAAAPTADCATDAELRANWPGFRGSGGAGVAATTNYPLRFAAENVLWQTPVPALGNGSPIVFGNRVFLTGGDAAKREVFCFDAKTGVLAWRQAVENVTGSPAQVPEIPEMTGYAASTPATDGRRVYALFANGDLAAFTLDGQRVWARHLGVPKNPYGHATSLATWRDRVIVLFDQGEPETRLSKLLALDGRTGQTVWEKPRPVGASWATPIVFEAAGKAQIVTLAVPWVIAYAAADGTELWRADALNGEVTPSPVFAGGLVVVVSPSEKLFALRPDGAGDVTKSHVAWTTEDNVPDVTSPVANGELAFTVTSGGLLLCFDLKDGKKIWEKDFEMEVQSSPSIVNDRVLVLGTKGMAVVAEAGRQFKEVGRGELADKFLASPAFAGGRVYLRGATNLWCVGAALEKGAKP